MSPSGLWVGSATSHLTLRFRFGQHSVAGSGEVAHAKELWFREGRILWRAAGTGRGATDH